MELTELTLHELIEQIDNNPGRLKTLIDGLYDRIEEKEDSVKAYTQIAEKDRLLDNAKEMVDRPLKGVPGAIKDNIQTEGFKTTCGSKILENYFSVYDATVVEKLGEAGSPVLGKTNMDEFAMGSSTENSAFFPTRNPESLNHVPGGSSGGSAAAVAAGEAVYALGSDTGGSIRQPAAFCGVVGLKPTYGLVSRYGLTAFASSLDQIGPITRDVLDAGLVLNCIAGADSQDSTSFSQSAADFTAEIDKGIEGMTVGFPREYFGPELSSGVKDAAQRWRSNFKGIGCELRDISLPHTEYAIPAYYLIACSEASANLARYDGVRFTHRSQEVKNVDDLFAKSRDEGFGPEVKRRILLGTYALSAGYYDKFYRKALKVRSLIKQDFDQAFSQVDLIAAPTTPTPAFKIGEKTEDPLQMYLSDILTVTANLAGIPAISIPAGEENGLPIGMQLMSESLSERKLLRAGFSFEQNWPRESIAGE